MKKIMSAIGGKRTGTIFKKMSNNWILGRFSRDLALIFLPGFAGIAVSFVFPPQPLYFLVYAFLASTFVNAGHVYTTAWRTIFRREERDSNGLYWMMPLAIVALVFCWLYFKVPYLWSFVVYVTVYHQIAQFYGFLKWYEKLNKKRSVFSGYFLLALTIVPFILFHFRQFQRLGFYTDQDIFFSPNRTLFRAGLLVYGSIVLAWLSFEVFLVLKRRFEPNRFLAIFAPAVLYAYCFLAGQSISEILFPLFLSHGIPYMAVTGSSLERLRQKPFGPVYKTVLIISLTALLGGLATRLYGAYLISISNVYVHTRTSSVTAVLTGIYLVPLLCHYVFDARIWKSKHRDAKIIYGDARGPSFSSKFL